MSKKSIFPDILFALILVCLMAVAVVGRQSTAFTYQGKLNDAGSPANGNYDLQFRLFDALVSGVQVGSTLVRDDVPASNGSFTVTLDFGASAFPGANRWLEVSVRPGASTGSFTSLSPLQPISATPYSIQSLNAATASGLSSACVGCVTDAQIGSLPINSGNYIQNSATLQAASNFNISGNGFIGGNVGIGTTTLFPGYKLDVNGQTLFRTGGSGGGFIAFGTPNTETGLTISGTGTTRADLRFDGSTLKLVAAGAGIPQATSGLVIGTSGNVGIGDADLSSKLSVKSDTSTAIRGESDSGFGVFATSNNIGVYGSSSSGSGVYGGSGASSLTAAGVFGFGANPGSIGIIGVSNLGTAVGVYGASQSSTGFGMYARNQSGGYAGYFDGNVFVNGTINKSAVGFKIDHPLDPANKYLYHSSVESPEMMNLYNGNLTTDEHGEATVTLPEWFGALNRDFRYQLTVIGVFAQAIVADKIKNNRFTIKTDKPQVEVSWQVTGIRQDAYANAHRMPIEEEKPEKERGYYLRPELFEQPEEKSVEWARDPVKMKQQKEERERRQREQDNKAVAPAAAAK